MLLLSTLSAYDFGYIGLVELLERSEFTFATLDKLQKFRGHYLNWYDTHTLQPLWPQYVSAVDSGNLAGHLIALKQACIELPDDEILNSRVISGLQDTIDGVIVEISQLTASVQRTDAITIKQIDGEVQACARLLASGVPSMLPQWSELIEQLNEHAAVIDDIVAAFAQEHGQAGFADLRWWTGSLLHQARAYRRDLHLLAPWSLVSRWSRNVWINSNVGFVSFLHFNTRLLGISVLLFFLATRRLLLLLRRRSWTVNALIRRLRTNVFVC